jgi:uncharacterized protein YqhQ
MAVSVRLPDGSIATQSAAFTPPFAQVRNVPFLRGLIAMGAAILLAFKSTVLQKRLDVPKQAGMKGQVSRVIAPAMVLTLMERGLRYLMGGRLRPERMKRGPGVFMMLLPLLVLRASGFLPSGKRLLQYHAAEHMAVNAVENGGEPTPENAATQSRIHPRCGTSFALWVSAIISWLSRGKKRGPAATVMMGLVAVSLAYELLRLGGNHREELWAKVILGPSWQAQRLTTMVPEREHLEVAAAALAAVIAIDASVSESEPDTTLV